MNPKLKMLLWKEWRERRGQLLICLGLAGACLFTAVVWWLVERTRADRLGHFPWGIIGWFYCVLMSLLVAMRTTGGETTDHTTAFSLTLPMSPRRTSWIRLLGGGAVLVAPIALVAALAALGTAIVGWFDAAPGRGLSGLLPAGWPQLWIVWSFAAILAAATIGCYVHVALLGTFARSENHAALLGAVWTIFWLVAAITGFGHGQAERRLLAQVSPQALSVLAWGADQQPQPSTNWGGAARLGQMLAPNLVLSLLVAVFFVGRHSRRHQNSGRAWLWMLAWRWPIGRLPAWRCGPLERIRATQWGALAWLAVRQSLPICLAAIGVSLVLSLTVLAAAPNRDLIHGKPWTIAAATSALMTLVVGILWASIVGVGSVADELDRRRGDFWRTRPIPFWRLFTIKFFVGLAVVLAVLNGPAAALSEAIAEESGSPSAWAYIACFSPLHAAMFGLALAWACSLRRIAVGAMAALACFIAVATTGAVFPGLDWLNPFVVYNQLEHDLQHGRGVDLWAAGYPGMVAVFVLTTVASYFVAGFALAAYQPRRQLS